MTECSAVKTPVRCENHVGHNPVWKASILRHGFLRAGLQTRRTNISVCCFCDTRGLRRPKFDFKQRLNFSFPMTSILAMRSAQLPIQRRSKTVKLTHLHLGPRSRMCRALSPCFLHVLMAWCIGTGTTDPEVKSSGRAHNSALYRSASLELRICASAVTGLSYSTAMLGLFHLICT
jgi:hypothetical protein